MTIKQLQEMYNVTMSDAVEQNLNVQLSNTNVIEVEYNTDLNYDREDVLSFELVCSIMSGLRADDCFISFGSEFFED